MEFSPLILINLMWKPSFLIKKFSYKILNPKGVEEQKEPKKIAQVILDAVKLDVESYRLGNTKAWIPMFIFFILFLLYLFLFRFIDMIPKKHHCKYIEWYNPPSNIINRWFLFAHYISWLSIVFDTDEIGY